MKKKILIIVAILFVFQLQKLSAQDYFYNQDYYDADLIYEAGASFGVMNCLTDLGGHKGLGKPFLKDFNFGNTQVNGSIYAGFTFKEIIGLRLEGSYGQVKSYDSILKENAYNTGGRYERNLSFKSRIAEITLLAEFNPVALILNHKHLFVASYFLGGIGFFSFNPQAKIGDRNVDLQPLSTEGQGFAEYPDRKPYKLTQINLPVGFGLKYDASHNLIIRAEVLYRILATDYLDDVSTTYIDPTLYSKYFSGDKLNDALILNDRRRKDNPDYPVDPKGGQIRGTKNNDAYFTFNIKVGYIFGRQKRRP